MKKLPYWLRGGIIAVVGILLAKTIFTEGRNIIEIIAWTIGSLQTPGRRVQMIYIIFHSLFKLSLYFVIGSFLGWIVGKIKQRKNTK